MCPAQLFDTVSLSYTAYLDSGEMIDNVPADKPITLTIGSGTILKAVEASMMNMEPGESKVVRILPEDAYGPHYPALVHELPRSCFAGRLDPQPGMVLSQTLEKDGKGQQVPAMVVAAGKDTVTIDYNHPLAGKAIIYKVRLHAIGN